MLPIKRIDRLCGSLLIVSLAVLYGETPALAQSVPPQLDAGGIQAHSLESMRRSRQDEKVRKELEHQPDKGGVDDAGDKEPAPAGSEKVHFELKKVSFGYSDILSEMELGSIAAHYQGRRVTVADLHHLLDEVNGLYEEKGYITAKAILPPQKIQDGQVTIRLVEARVGAVQVEGVNDLASEFVRERVAYSSGDLMRVGPLEHDLELFNWTNEAKLRARLAPGEKFGTTDLILGVQEPKPKTLSVFVDNAQRSAVAPYRVGINYAVAALSGRSDPLKLGLTGSDGDLNGSLSYEFPVGLRGDRLTVSYVRGDMAIRHGDFSSLGITGRSTVASVAVHHPLRVSAESKLGGYVSAQQKHSFTWIDSVAIADVKIVSGSLGLEYERAVPGMVVYTGHEWNHGLGDAANAAPHHFDKYTGYLSWAKALSSGTLRIQGVWQVSEEPNLPAAELFQIGGMYSVRGFDEGLSSGHAGYYLTVERRVPLNTVVHGAGEGTDLVAFVDHGMVRYQSSSGVSIDHLTSLGLGGSRKIGERLSLTLYAALPVGRYAATVNRKPKLNLYLQYDLL